MKNRNIHVIDDGDYQGTLLYIIPEKGYQPSEYWAVKVSYGSCSGCDTMESIRSDYEPEHWEDDYKPSDQQIDLLWTEALHMMQGMKTIGGKE